MRLQSELIHGVREGKRVPPVLIVVPILAVADAVGGGLLFMEECMYGVYDGLGV